jgi:glycosyltransferase involved in cell wall biosynthesis
MSNTPVKILFYTDTPLYGGAERQLFLLLKNLDRQKFLPVLVCRNTSALQNWAKECQNLNIKVYQITSSSKHSLSNYFQVKKIVLLEQPEILHGQIWNPMAGKYLFLLKKTFDIPLIITEHDPFPLNFPKTIYKKWANKLADQIICVSHSNQKLLENLYPNLKNKIEVIHNGLEPLENKINAAERAMTRTQIFQLSPNSKTKIIFSAGTLHNRKGYHILLEALAKIKSTFPDFKLVIAGEGPEHQNLADLRKNLNLDHQVLLLGQRDDIAKLMQSADLFILPSLKEAFGLVILEAMQANLPIIASLVGGIPEILGNNYPFLTEPNNADQLAEKIQKYLNNPGIYSEIISNYPAILERFSAQSTALQTEKIYQKTLSN